MYIKDLIEGVALLLLQTFFCDSYRKDPSGCRNAKNQKINSKYLRKFQGCQFHGN